MQNTHFFFFFSLSKELKMLPTPGEEILIFGEENRNKKASFGVYFEIAILTCLNKTQGKRFDKDFHASPCVRGSLESQMLQLDEEL